MPTPQVDDSQTFAEQHSLMSTSATAPITIAPTVQITGYVGHWPEHQEGERIIETDEYVGRIDLKGNIDWETSKAYDASVLTNCKYNHSKYHSILNDAALLEVSPCDGLTRETRKQFKRLIGEALRCSFEFDYVDAKNMIRAAGKFVRARSEEVSRRWYLFASFLATSPFALIGAIIWGLRDKAIHSFGIDATWMSLSAVAGAIGALLSVITRTGRLKFDCSAGWELHLLEGVSRIVAGAISGLIVALAIRSDLIFTALSQGIHIHKIMIVGALAGGAGERLATSIISKFDAGHIDLSDNKNPSEPTGGETHA